MSLWHTLLQPPADFSDGPVADRWFTQIADRLLQGTQLIVGKQPHRFVEAEFYYYNDQHPDVFAHRDPLQLHVGRWYFHRTRGTYRSGSFKGMDLTFGDGKAFGGILIRSIERPDGILIDGPSLCVDYLLDSCGASTVAILDAAINQRVAWDAENPLRLHAIETESPFQILRSARVGLSLKKVRSAEATRFIMRPYRYLSEPRRVSKGKPQMVLALHAQGISSDRIREVTGATKQSIQRYIDDFESGRREKDFTPYFGIDLGPKELCRLHGTWYAQFGGDRQ